jgi:hypothetical protein
VIEEDNIILLEAAHYNELIIADPHSLTISCEQKYDLYSHHYVCHVFRTFLFILLLIGSHKDKEKNERLQEKVHRQLALPANDDRTLPSDFTITPILNKSVKILPNEAS